MRRFLVLVGVLVLVSDCVGGANATRPSMERSDYADNWQGITFVSGLNNCPLLGAKPSPYYVLREVALTDQISSEYTPDQPPLFRISSFGSLHGVIHAQAGTYTVTGRFHEQRVGDLEPRYFSGVGEATISGPAGSLTGKATFHDLLDFPPQEFDLRFTALTRCLKT